MATALSSISGTAVVLPVARHKVSSVLNKSSEFASKHMFDGNEDTCWNSHQGSPQFILLEFKDPVVPVEITAVFQGGFVGQDAVIDLLSGDTADTAEAVHSALWDTLEDNNTAQSKRLSDEERKSVKFIKITFPTSTDFYGRVTIYKLQPNRLFYLNLKKDLVEMNGGLGAAYL